MTARTIQVAVASAAIINELTARLEAAQAELAALKAERALACIWRHNEWNDYWETACGEAFILEEGTPAENGMQFCHHCGKRLEEKVPVVEEEPDDENDDAPSDQQSEDWSVYQHDRDAEVRRSGRAD